VILILALAVGYFGFGSIVAALGGIARAMLSVFVAVFLISLASKAIPWRRRSSRNAAQRSEQRAGSPAPA
jgi:uncharacterized membrane protein YtjA (UPF0391 family)